MEGKGYCARRRVPYACRRGSPSLLAILAGPGEQGQLAEGPVELFTRGGQVLLHPCADNGREQGTARAASRAVMPLRLAPPRGEHGITLQYDGRQIEAGREIIV